MSNNETTQKKNNSILRNDLACDLGEELGKSIYKQLTINEKYLNHNLTYAETKMLIDYMYAKIFELLYKDQYGEKAVK